MTSVTRLTEWPKTGKDGKTPGGKTVTAKTPPAPPKAAPPPAPRQQPRK